MHLFALKSLVFVVFFVIFVGVLRCSMNMFMTPLDYRCLIINLQTTFKGAQRYIWEGRETPWWLKRPSDPKIAGLNQASQIQCHMENPR